MPAKNDLRFISVGIRDEVDPETRRNTGDHEVVVLVATAAGTTREVVIKDADEAMRLIADLASSVCALNKRARTRRPLTDDTTVAPTGTNPAPKVRP